MNDRPVRGIGCAAPARGGTKTLYSSTVRTASATWTSARIDVAVPAPETAVGRELTVTSYLPPTPDRSADKRVRGTSGWLFSKLRTPADLKRVYRTSAYGRCACRDFATGARAQSAINAYPVATELLVGTAPR